MDGKRCVDMFCVIKKPYGIYNEEVVSRHRTKEMANKKCEEVKQKHELNLYAGGWKADGTEFYVKEI